MEPRYPFRVVTPTLDGDVLRVLAEAEASLTGREINRRVGHSSHEGVRLALDRLAGQGIVGRTRAGTAILYRLNRDHLAAPWIEGLASLRLQLIDRLRTALEGWAIRPSLAVLFGSFARGDAGRESDLDLLLVRPHGCDTDDATWRDQVASLEAAASAWTGNDARVLEYGEAEARRLGRSEPVLAEAASEGVELAGSLGTLRRATRSRQ